MKKASPEQMITKKQKELMIFGKGLACDLKAIYSDDEYKFSASELERLITLSKNNPEEYISELIDLNFEDDFILEECTSRLLPYQLKGNKKFVHFAGSSYEVYFVDDAIKHLSDKIDKLKLKRIEDSRTYAVKMIETGRVQNLNFNFFYGFPFTQQQYCECENNIDDYCIKTSPNTLYYGTAIGSKKKIDSADIKNMIDILDKFVLVHGPIKNIEISQKKLVAESQDCDYINGYVVIKHLDNAPRKLVKKIYSLKQSNQ